MKRIFKLLQSPPITLAIAALLAYGILIPQLGFYWDDLPISWLRYELGPDALTTYFSTNRPAWGVWYNFLTGFIPHQPIYWQILALFWRWLSSLTFFGVLHQLFPNHKKLATIASLLFLLYPGFNQQSVSFVYGYHFTVYTLFIFSLYAMLRTFRRPSIALTPLGLLASALNLVMGEYFFVLDLIRPVLLWFTLQDIPIPRQRIKRTFAAWIPYLVILAVGVLGRSLIFNNQIYDYSLLDELKAAPLLALWELIQTIALSLWTTFVSAWGQAFVLPDFQLQGKVTIVIYLFIIITLSVYLLLLFRKKNTDDKPQSTKLITIGVFAMLLAGVPFWLTDLPITLGFPANRATMPFIFGSVFTLAGILSLIPRKTFTTILFTVLIAFSAGRQFLWADEFRRDWRVHKNLFWQLSWRVPALEEDTLIMLNEGALKYYADNSLAAPLNWIYAPEATTDSIPYMLFYPRSRFGADAERLQPDMPLSHDFIASEWSGNSNKMLLINFDPPGCLHIVDPALDERNKFIADLLIRDNATYSHPELIFEAGTPLIPALYEPEPSHRWCYFYAKADLARQFGDWDAIASLSTQAFNIGDHPNDPTEYFPFIEGLAHTGDWARAKELSLSAYRVSKQYMSPMLCSLWERIETETHDNPEKEDFFVELKTTLKCDQVE